MADGFSLPSDTLQPATLDKDVGAGEQSFALPSEEVTPTTSGPMAWADVGTQALQNLPRSAVGVAESMAQTVMHPIDTANALRNLGQGVMEKLGINARENLGLAPEDHIKYADAFGKFLWDRYGSLENIKHTMASDPAGFMMDASAVLTGGGSAAARVPGAVGAAGEALSTIGRTIDPMSAAMSAVSAPVKIAGHIAPEVIGELGTHTGAQSLKEAFGAGYEGGEGAKAFVENMRGIAPMEDTVLEARKGVAAIRNERGSTYREQMVDIANDPTVLDFDKIDSALADITKIKTFKGIPISESTDKVRQKIAQDIQTWKMLDPAEFHTPEGLDALKQKIGDIKDNIPLTDRPSLKVANDAYNAIRQTIVAQAPQYGKIMEGYTKASKQLDEIERTLSLNPNATIDTSLRKLQSVLRNNVNTSYGRRKELADYLVNAGAPNLMKKIAGQTLSQWAPRGMGRVVASGLAELGILGAGAGLAGISGAVAAAPVGLALMSPRLMGETFYGAGRLASPFKYAPPRTAVTTPAFQAGRLYGLQPQSRGGKISAAMSIAKRMGKRK